jgi:asparaginyl-tRNA synthetase
MIKTQSTVEVELEVAVERQERFSTIQERYLRIIADPWYATLVDIQDLITTSTVGFFSAQGLKNLHLPITTHSISSPMGLGSDSLPVEIELFDVRTYLADSMQFMLEYGCRLNRRGSYYLMPSFRGEQADKTHLCQFFHSEAEIAGGLEEVMLLIETYIREMTGHIVERIGDRIAQVAGGLDHIDNVMTGERFPRITVDEAVLLLGNKPRCVKHHPEGFVTITRAGEQQLMEHFGGVVWLTKPDHLSVPFYQAFCGPEGKKAKAADLLFGMGETVGCGERHATADQVRAALANHDVDEEPYEWYIRMREVYPMQTAGFGLGVERFICWLLRHEDIRDCQLLERYNGQRTIP